jgi:hypothetical protein
MDAFVFDCLSRFGLRPGGGGPWSDEARKQLLSTAWPPAPLPVGYDDADGLNDFVAYLQSALGLATAVSCARCGVSGELPPEILGFLVIVFRRSEDRPGSCALRRRGRAGRGDPVWLGDGRAGRIPLPRARETQKPEGGQGVVDCMERGYERRHPRAAWYLGAAATVA